MEFPQEKSEGPHDIEWMEVDNHEWARLNVGKHFDKTCQKSLISVNIGTSLLMQELSEVQKQD